MKPIDLHLGHELFERWQKARGNRIEQASRPYSIPWEKFLEEIGIVSASERQDAETDAKTLEKEGWIKLTFVRYRANFIDRLQIPLDAEPRWCECFRFVSPTDEEARRIREYDWSPELRFIREHKILFSFEELKQIDDFLKSPPETREMIPIKERSLQIFKDEKRLDLLMNSTLFGEGRLDLVRDLKCEMIGVPLAWRRGPKTAQHQPILVIENAATWHSYSRWNMTSARFSAVVYGDGNRFIDGIRYIADLFTEIGGVRKILYFGDIDPQGLRIPQIATDRGRPFNLPPVEPDLSSYANLLEFSALPCEVKQSDPPEKALCDWLGELSEPAYRVICSGHRLPQEHISWEVLRTKSIFPQ